MKLRTVKCYRTKTGVARYIRLYRAWWNMNSRVRGNITSSSGNNYWLDLPITFKDWPHFREWSLSHGYSATNCSLDRIRSQEGYGPDNCRWVTCEMNSGITASVRKQNLAIIQFQQEPITPEEQYELDTVLGIWHCPYMATINLG